MRILGVAEHYSFITPNPNERRNTLDNMIVQGALWVGSAATLLLYFRRRRSRKMMQ